MISRIAPHQPSTSSPTLWDDNPSPQLTIVALHRDMVPPFVFGSQALRRMRIVIMDQRDAWAYARAVDPAQAPKPVPQLPPARSQALRHSRAVQGEILCDESGQLYERVGQYVRRVHHLATSPNGQLLDLDPDGAPSWPPAADVRAAVHDPESKPQEDDREAPDSPAARMLLTPGTRRVLRFGDIRAIVESQIARPDRLRDSHLLNCFVQVVEAVRAQPIAALVPMPPSGEPSKAAIQRLTPQLGELMGVPHLVRRADREHSRQDDTARPGERFALIQVAVDPTAAIDRARASRPPDAPAAVADPPRSTIAAAYLRPWEFVRTRAEAEYDGAAARSRGILARCGDAVRRALFERAAYRRWRALLAGKSADEQLWAIRPPRGAFNDAAVLQWADRLLAEAGYDRTTMMREWELFWRRKGV
jgi:hypothetical protein